MTPREALSRGVVFTLDYILKEAIQSIALNGSMGVYFTACHTSVLPGSSPRVHQRAW